MKAGNSCSERGHIAKRGVSDGSTVESAKVGGAWERVHPEMRYDMLSA